METTELRVKILQALMNWEHSGKSAIPNVAEIAGQLNVPIKDLVDQLDILEADSAVKVQRAFGDGSNNSALITGTGKRLFEELSTSAQKEASHGNSVGRKQNHVFVVHGRNTELRQSIFIFLKALGLDPMEWDQAIAATGKASPYIGEILDAAFARASAIVVLATGDDEARLIRRFINPEDPKYEGDLTPQPRPNVLFEAGLAMGRNQTGTILVEVGNLRPWSDIAGRHVTHLNNSRHSREELANKLRIAGCDVDLSRTEWLTAGNFGDLPKESSVTEITGNDVRQSQSPASGNEEEYNFSGVGPATTKPFTIRSSPWKLRYEGNWNGHFAVQVRGTRIELVVNRPVSAGKTYETYVHDQVGRLHFSVVDAPPDGTWNLLVLQPDD